MTPEALREVVARKLEANPSIKTGMLAETLGVPEADVMRALPEGRARELRTDKLEELVTALAGLGTVYLVVRNACCVAEITGTFGGFSRSGPFLNVAGTGMHLHLRLDRIASVFAVVAPVAPGGPATPSLQFFDAEGASAFKVFVMELMQSERGEDAAAARARFEELARQHT